MTIARNRKKKKLLMKALQQAKDLPCPALGQGIRRTLALQSMPCRGRSSIHASVSATPGNLFWFFLFLSLSERATLEVILSISEGSGVKTGAIGMKSTLQLGTDGCGSGC
jgi:hypothetical protein